MFDNVGLNEKEKYFKQLVKQHSFAEVKKRIRIGDCFDEIYGMQVVIGFDGDYLIYTDAVRVQKGNIKEKHCNYYNVVAFLYNMNNFKNFYTGYSEDLACAILKCKLQNEYVRYMKTEMQDEVYDSIFQISSWNRVSPIVFSVLRVAFILGILVLELSAFLYGVLTGNYVYAIVGLLGGVFMCCTVSVVLHGIYDWN